MDATNLKTCSKCKTVKAFEFFRKSERGLYGLHSVCRACANVRVKEYQAKNKEAVLAKKKEYRDSNQQKIKNYMAEYREKNKEKIKIKRDEYCKKNAEMLSKKSRQWAKDHPLERRAQEHKRRALKLGNGGKHTAADVRKIHALQGHKCACCGVNTKSKFHVDHIMPLVLGGTNDASNLQILCPTCNNQKYSKHPVDFMQDKGFLL